MSVIVTLVTTTWQGVPAPLAVCPPGFKRGFRRAAISMSNHMVTTYVAIT